MRLAYVDSCVWITLIEGLESYRPTIQNALASLAHEGWELCTSDAVRLEVQVRPQRLGDNNLVEIYEALLDAARTLPVQPAVFKDALVTRLARGSRQWTRSMSLSPLSMVANGSLPPTHTFRT